jgi:hypothetical protein
MPGQRVVVDRVKEVKKKLSKPPGMYEKGAKISGLTHLLT